MGMSQIRRSGGGNIIFNKKAWHSVNDGGMANISVSHRQSKDAMKTERKRATYSSPVWVINSNSLTINKQKSP